MAKLIKRSEDYVSIFDDSWILHFQEHKSMRFKTKEDVEKYINGEDSEAHGYMEYEKIPVSVTHMESYDIELE